MKPNKDEYGLNQSCYFFRYCSGKLSFFTFTGRNQQAGRRKSTNFSSNSQSIPPIPDHLPDSHAILIRHSDRTRDSDFKQNPCNPVGKRNSLHVCNNRTRQFHIMFSNREITPCNTPALPAWTHHSSATAKIKIASQAQIARRSFNKPEVFSQQSDIPFKKFRRILRRKKLFM